MIATRLAVKIADEDKATIMQAIATLPPHPEVTESITRLKQSGFTIAALTNSTQVVAEKQLTNAGLVEYFDKIVSAGSVQKVKPAKEPYVMAGQSFDVQPRDIRLIAAHAWDIAGALRAGYAAAFIARPCMVLDPLVEEPGIVGANLSEVVSQIIELEAA